MPVFRNAFVTGASSGIGRELAVLLGAQGTHVVAAARREPELAEIVEQITKAGGQANACVLDVTDADATYQAVRSWDKACGGLDLVIANAGTGVAKPAQKLAWSDVEPVLRVNVLGAFATLMAGISCMIGRKHGTLVGVSSLASMRGLPKSGAYAASKAALATFLETLRVDLEREGLTVVDVRPGFVDTPMTRNNKFKMPFLMDVKQAAEMTLRGIERGNAIVAFPWPMAATMSVAQSIPNAVWRGLASRVKL
ncbi:MAG: SDR family NAD(P)-dependent oxidoreductase [Polyangiaceae bacterium]|nr:SDR family NAD(P)-dependent oxidoreductase [Polyangiaceae bacterium]